MGSPSSGEKDTTWGREPGCSLQSSMSSVVYMTSMWGGQGNWKSSPKITWQKRGKEEPKRRLRSCPLNDMKPWYEAVMGLPPQCDSWVGSCFSLDSWATAQHWKQIISCSINYEAEMTHSHNKRTHKQVNWKVQQLTRSSSLSSGTWWCCEGYPQSQTSPLSGCLAWRDPVVRERERLVGAFQKGHPIPKHSSFSGLSEGVLHGTSGASV